MLAVSTAPYIKKFVDVRFGNPIRLHNRTSWQILLRGILFKTAQLSFFHNKENNLRILPCTVYIEQPTRHEINDSNLSVKTRLINQFFENLFMEEMKAWMDQYAARPRRNNRTESSLLVQIERFCKQFGIEINEDVEQDAIVKMFYRYRKWLSAVNCPLSEEVHQPSLKDAIL